ncbi:hypothetical protein [Saccharothrix syringae]|uniref:hypothetical protein n=1 Tax=Saccharothrix syringae TaxID=103733 RepID=UPI0005276350|nr:hypothetical protein [Saccharothrix syringae]
MSNRERVPAAVRVAGALTSLQALVGLAFAVALVVRAFSAVNPGGVVGEAVYFTVLSGGVGVAGVGLVLGKRWGTTPAFVVQLLLLGVAWYMYGPSGQQLWGALVGAYSLVIVVLLFTPQVRRWAAGLDEADE